MTITVHHIEAVQAIQNLENSVDLVWGKNPTYVRVYLTSDAVTTDVSGELKISISGNPQLVSAKLIKPLRNLKQEISELLSVRREFDSTLNFLFEMEDAGTLFDNQDSTKIDIKLHSLKVDGKDESVEGNTTVTVNVKKPQKLNIRVIAYRYEDLDSGEIRQPGRAEMDDIRRFVSSAFPISSVEWSVSFIDAPSDLKFLRRRFSGEEAKENRLDALSMLMFQHLMALRNQELSTTVPNLNKPLYPALHQGNSGQAIEAIDASTIYLGVLNDPSGQIGGSAMDSPSFPTPHVVAITEEGAGGELGAHELAHLLGLEHPGVPDKRIHGRRLGQTDQYESNDRKSMDTDTLVTKSAKNKVHRLGYLSNENLEEKLKIYGLDSRGAFSENIESPNSFSSPQVLDPLEVFDLMTYRYPKWMSKFTYDEIYLRASEIDSNKSKFQPDRLDHKSDITHVSRWYVTGSYNFNQRSAQISYVLPTSIDVNNHSSSSNSTEQSKKEGDLYIQVEWVKISKKALFNKTNNIQSYAYLDTKKSDPELIYTRSNPTRTDNNRQIGVFQHTISNSGLYVGDEVNDFVWRPARLFLLIKKDNLVDVHELEKLRGDMLGIKYPDFPSEDITSEPTPQRKFDPIGSIHLQLTEIARLMNDDSSEPLRENRNYLLLNRPTEEEHKNYRLGSTDDDRTTSRRRIRKLRMSYSVDRGEFNLEYNWRDGIRNAHRRVYVPSESSNSDVNDFRSIIEDLKKIARAENGKVVLGNSFAEFIGSKGISLSGTDIALLENLLNHILSDTTGLPKSTVADLINHELKKKGYQRVLRLLLSKSASGNNLDKFFGYETEDTDKLLEEFTDLHYSKVDFSQLSILDNLSILLSVVRVQKVPVTTTIQFLRQPNNFKDYGGWAMGEKSVLWKGWESDKTRSSSLESNWQTVFISNETIQKNIWISPEYIGYLKDNGYTSSLYGGEIPYMEQISEFMRSQSGPITISELGVRFRILLTVAGYSVEVFDSYSDLNLLKIKPEDFLIDIQGFGNLGRRQLNYSIEHDKGFDRGQPDKSLKKLRDYYRPLVPPPGG